MDFIKEEVPELEDLYEAYQQGNTLECLLVDLGDAVSVLQYVNREIAHGNSDQDMKVIHNEVSMRVINLSNQLSEKIRKEFETKDDE